MENLAGALIVGAFVLVLTMLVAVHFYNKGFRDGEQNELTRKKREQAAAERKAWKPV